ncbi:hypothetical protein UY3_14311 [Chelonia mydas]|uniref:Uncharacterized protein n=1 Tax=Chelonia mydas TaxID=8469 RepID=M7AV18_CHEMY|nr:hypothetical protein UY3_14311 [Chelonia mydas]
MEEEGRTLLTPTTLLAVEPEDPDYSPGNLLMEENAREAEPLSAEEAAACSMSQRRGRWCSVDRCRKQMSEIYTLCYPTSTGLSSGTGSYHGLVVGRNATNTAIPVLETDDSGPVFSIPRSVLGSVPSSRQCEGSFSVLLPGGALLGGSVPDYRRGTPRILLSVFKHCVAPYQQRPPKSKIGEIAPYPTAFIDAVHGGRCFSTQLQVLESGPMGVLLEERNVEGITLQMFVRLLNYSLEEIRMPSRLAHYKKQ